MKALHRLYHFFGSIRFALILISTTALFVIAGTLIESSTQSHRFASHYTYGNPVFGLLLWGFFVNILFSAMRRWPFKVRHVPFLITHLGLLMILSGVLIKHYFGVQGSMSIVEGTASNEIVETGSYAIHIESRNATSKRYPLNKTFDGSFDNIIADTEDGLHLRLAGFTPHSTEWLATWIKGDRAVIAGLTPMPIYDTEGAPSDTGIPLSGRVRFNKDAAPWQIFALNSSEPTKALEAIFYQNAHIRLTSRLNGKTITEIPLKDFPIKLENAGMATLNLHLNFSPITGFDNPHLQSLVDGNMFHMEVPLEGKHALLNINLSTPYLGSLPFAIDIKMPPTLVVLEDQHRDVHLVAIGPYGQLWWRPFRTDNLESLLAYDNGFGGYAVQTELPFQTPNYTRAQREEAINHRLLQQLQLALLKGEELSPPLQFWQRTCQNASIDFSESMLAFLIHWDATHSWLYPPNVQLPSSLTKVLETMDWSTILPSERLACQWTHTLFSQIEPFLKDGKDLFSILKQNKWPLLSILEVKRSKQGPITPEETVDLLTHLTQQVFAAAELRPVENDDAFNSLTNPEQQAVLFSAYLRAYGIHLNTITPLPATTDEMTSLLTEYQPNQKPHSIPDASPITIETSVIPYQRPLPPTSKLEDNFPLIKLHARKGKLMQETHLTYDPYATGLKWPILNGEYLVRFQPNFTSIPYRIRLRNARQINYPNSSQPYSYESDLIITDRRTGQSVEKMISMNNVHETWDGYRFYLASMSPSTEDTIKRVQLVVNHDPAKYFLTYPGALILSLGILLLFSMRPYRQRK